jgi:hypothetical protein
MRERYNQLTRRNNACVETRSSRLAEDGRLGWKQCRLHLSDLRQSLYREPTHSSWRAELPRLRSIHSSTHWQSQKRRRDSQHRVVIDGDHRRIQVAASTRFVLSKSPYCTVSNRIMTSSSANLPPHESNTILARLLEDRHVGVRKFALQSISAENENSIRAKIQKVEAQDPVSFVRDHARLKRRELENKSSLPVMKVDPFKKPDRHPRRRHAAKRRFKNFDQLPLISENLRTCNTAD